MNSQFKNSKSRAKRKIMQSNVCVYTVVIYGAA